jgi:hypothetical protein
MRSALDYVRVAPTLSGFPLKAEGAIALESSDLFQRPIRSIWRKGDLWPAYVETNGGHSTLILQEKQQ